MNAQAVTASAIKQERALKKKRLIKRGGIGGGALLFVYALYLLFKPYTGTITYGVCKTFLETQAIYPSLLRLSGVDDYGAQVRIWYTQVDSFGEYRLDSITCLFRGVTDADDKKYGQTMPFALDKVSMGRRDLDPAVIDRFNYSIPAIIASKPNLILPSPLPDSLKGLQIDTTSFLKPIF